MPGLEVGPVLWAAAAGVGAAGVTAGFAKLWALGTGQARIEQKLDDHIVDERGKFEGFTAQLQTISGKLPNGELHAILEKVGRMESMLVPKGRKKAADAARRKKR